MEVRVDTFSSVERPDSTDFKAYRYIREMLLVTESVIYRIEFALEAFFVFAIVRYLEILETMAPAESLSTSFCPCRRCGSDDEVDVLLRLDEDAHKNVDG